MQGKKSIIPDKALFENYYYNNSIAATALHFGVSEWMIHSWRNQLSVVKKLYLTSHSTQKLNSIQEQILLGSLLGDGSLTSVANGYINPNITATNSSFREGHGAKQADWTLWKYFILRAFCNVEPIWNKSSNSLQFYTICHDVFTNLEAQWYLRDGNGYYIIKENKRVKILPSGLVLTPLMMAVWYVDDGWHDWNSKERRVFLATHCFSRDECEMLVVQLKNLNISDCGVKRIKGYNVIRIGSKSFKYFLDIVKNELDALNSPKCIQYKYILENYCEPIEMRGETHPSAKNTKEEVMQIINLANQGLGIKEISTISCKPYGFISNIIYRKSWRSLSDKYLFTR